MKYEFFFKLNICNFNNLITFREICFMVIENKSSSFLRNRSIWPFHSQETQFWAWLLTLSYVCYRIVSNFLSMMSLIWKFPSNFTRLYELKPVKIIRYVDNYFRFEVLTVVYGLTMEITLFWDIRPCSRVEVQRSWESLVKFLLTTWLYTSKNRTFLWEERDMHFRPKHLYKIGSERILKPMFVNIIKKLWTS
jgi:hypothetical protein